MKVDLQTHIGSNSPCYNCGCLSAPTTHISQSNAFVIVPAESDCASDYERYLGILQEALKADTFPIGGSLVSERWTPFVLKGISTCNLFVRFSPLLAQQRRRTQSFCVFDLRYTKLKGVEEGSLFNLVYILKQPVQSELLEESVKRKDIEKEMLAAFIANKRVRKAYIVSSMIS
jgi:hypothetical protein